MAARPRASACARLGPAPDGAADARRGALLSALAMGAPVRRRHDPSRVYFGTDTHASGLLIGALLAFVWPLGGLRSTPRPGAAILLDVAALAGLGVVLLAMLSLAGLRRLGLPRRPLDFAIASAVLIAAVSHPSCRVAIGLGVAPMRWIGAAQLRHLPVALAGDGAHPPGRRPALEPVAAHPAADRRRGGDRRRRRTAGSSSRSAAARAASASPTWIAAARRVAGSRSPPRRVVAVALPVAGSGSRPAGSRADQGPLERRGAALGRDATAGTPRRAERRADAAAGAIARPAAARGRRVGDARRRRRRSAGTRPSTRRSAARRRDIIGRLEAYKAAGQLPDRVIVQIGENGPVWGRHPAAARGARGRRREVLLVNVARAAQLGGRGQRDPRPETVDNWPRGALVDWHDASAAKPGLLYDDATHPNPDGQEVYAKLVERALREHG